MEDQVAFADLSGDRNPAHLEPIVARRTMFGGVVVHGVHTLLWAMDQCIPASTQRMELASLRVEFIKPIRLGDRIFCVRRSVSESSFELEVFRDCTLTLYARLELRAEQIRERPNIERYETPISPSELQVNELEGHASIIPLNFNENQFREKFGALHKALPSIQISQLLAITRLVGMECPGLHSALVAFELLFLGDARGPNLAYRVKEFDDRTHLVYIEVASDVMTGEVRAFVRPSAQDQAALSRLKQIVERSEFQGQRALVVGGSRGLGELSAKMLAAGGAEVRITYRSGEEDAHRVRGEIHRDGGRCDMLQLDVLNPKALSEFEWPPTHLYYFATPFIFRGQAERFSAELFYEFCEYYVVAYQRIVSTLIPMGLKRILYPSSIAVNEFPAQMREYATAKAAGEELCQFLRANQKLLVISPRFARLNTDQTANPLADNLDPVLPVLESLRALSRL